MKKNTILRLVMAVMVVGILWSVCSPLSVEAKSRRLSTKSKSLSVGQEYTIKMKGISTKDKRKGRKVKWRVSDKSVTVIKGKKNYSITLRARKAGKVKVTATYRGKKYNCKVTVKDKDDKGQNEVRDEEVGETSGDIHLNASEATIYYLSDTDSKYLSKPAGHIYSYQFKVEGIKKSEYVGWSIESDSKVSCFKVDHGRVYMWKSPGYEQKCEEARVVATLENGSRITAKLYGYSERNITVEEVVNDFVSGNLTADMTEYEKLDAIAAYVSQAYEYQLYQPDWLLMVLSGSGDCFSSRCFVTYLCRAAGIRAVPCVGDNLDGMTLAKADGKFYVVLTGFKDNQPRKYRIYEPPADSLQSIVTRSHIDLSYFD